MHSRSLGPWTHKHVFLGVGHARKPEPVWMKAGDTCEIEIEGIGVLHNPIEDERT